MTTAIRRQKNPPPLPRAAKRDCFPDIQFRVVHGRVVEAFEAKVPLTHGGGYTFKGYGRSWVNTTVRDELSAWLVDHQSGQQHKIDFGTEYLPMRFGNDVSLLWANGQLAVIANHTTGQIKYPPLNRPILQERNERLAWIAVLVFVGLSFFGSLFAYYASLIVCGLLAESHHTKMPMLTIFAITTLLTLLIAGVPSGALFALNRRNRDYNRRQSAYLSESLRMAESQWVRNYVPPPVTC